MAFEKGCGTGFQPVIPWVWHMGRMSMPRISTDHSCIHSLRAVSSVVLTLSPRSQPFTRCEGESEGVKTGTETAHYGRMNHFGGHPFVGDFRAACWIIEIGAPPEDSFS